MFKKNIIAAALIISGFALSGTASAQRYIGVTVGQASWDINCAGTTSCKKTDTAFKAFGGYDFSPMWGVEGSFFSVGTASASDGTIKGDFKGSGFDVAGIMKAPIGNHFVAFGKLGLAFVKGETTGTVGSVSGSVSKNSTQAVLGFGVLYKVSSDTSLRAEVERRNVKVADLDNATASVINVSVGVQASF